VNDAMAPEEATAWHRRFAAAANNRAWDLSVQRRTPVHALRGFGRSALAYAEEMRQYFLGVQSPDWEVAFVHVIHAHAASAAGETEKHRASYGLALTAIEAVSNEEERRNVAGTFKHVPKP